MAPTTILSLLTRLENKNFVSVEKQGKKISSEEIQDLSDFLKELDEKEE
ncbi:MAG: BlaI/MecI/CopY family transcriptional regulator [Oliverpabstia sp.]|nr:BlaI/MecI/CopY family transcriptional regulator [Oliverpabstia sp.]